jgi:membrane associated rhomboid family serine protease
MRTLGRLSIASLLSLITLAVAYYLGSLFLMLFDSNHHDGFAATGGLVIGLIAAVVVFRATVKKLSTQA